MKNFHPETFGQQFADIYDRWYGTQLQEQTTQQTVDLLADLAAGGTVLELAIGTGRVALPLAARGLTVQGIDASPEMVAKLRAKPGGESIPVTIGDFADVAIDGSYDLVFLVFNTLFNLTSQDEQVRCFQNVTQHLNPGGKFVIEAFVPDVTDFPDNQGMRTVHMTTEAVYLEASIHDPVTQVVQYQYIEITQDGTNLYPLPMRYAWPSELDLMARLAGLDLHQRWSGWDRAPFTASSTDHVSVYQRP